MSGLQLEEYYKLHSEYTDEKQANWNNFIVYNFARIFFKNNFHMKKSHK